MVSGDRSLGGGEWRSLEKRSIKDSVFDRGALIVVKTYPAHMDPLPRKCVPCEGGISPLGDDEAQERALLVPKWGLADARISRSFVLENFRAALAWVNRVGMLAEEHAHHPNFHIRSWNQVELVLWTHAVDGLTDNDFVLARAIDALAEKDGLSS